MQTDAPLDKLNNSTNKKIKLIQNTDHSIFGNVKIGQLMLYVF